MIEPTSIGVQAGFAGFCCAGGAASSSLKNRRHWGIDGVPDFQLKAVGTPSKGKQFEVHWTGSSG